MVTTVLYGHGRGIAKIKIASLALEKKDRT
jgi:hypothetical protein